MKPTLSAKEVDGLFTWEDVDALQAGYLFIEHEWQKQSELYPGSVSFTQRGKRVRFHADRFMEAVGRIVALLPPRDK